MYLDSAIIVKLLVREPDSAWFNQQIGNHELWSSAVALAEVRSAILIKERTGQVSVAERKAAFTRFHSMHEEDTLRWLPLNLAIAERAAGLLVSCHPEVALRSLDAIHLATAFLYPRGLLCTTDGKLRAAAKRIGLACYPEELSEIVTN